MSNYKITESVGRRIETVNSYDDLEKHHPSAGRERGRDYLTIDGQLEEVRIKGRPEPHVKKDFIIDPPTIPAPASGTIRSLNDQWNTVQIIGDNGQVLAQSLHMARGSQPPNGTRIEYGQTMGRMGDIGSPGSVHAHVEAPAAVFERYINDITSGRIRPGNQVNVDPLSDGVLDRGDRGPKVEELQRVLTARGFDTKGTDGTFGQNTENAVKAFQTQQNIQPADGIVGPRTAQALGISLGETQTNPTAPTNPTTPSTPTSPSNTTPSAPTTQTPEPQTPAQPNNNAQAVPAGTYREGDNGEGVRALQEALRRNGAQIEADGRFGPRTEAAVMEFQQKNGLQVDGIAGAQTIAKLNESLQQSQTQPTAPTNGTVTRPVVNGEVVFEAPNAPQPTPGNPQQPTTTAPQPTTPTAPSNETPTPSNPQTPAPNAEARVQASGQLQQGDSGPAVKQLQEALAQHGAQCRCGGHGLTTDGQYGDITKRAVEQFQEFRGLPVTGVADGQTLQALGINPQTIQATQGQQTPTQPTAPTPPTAPSNETPTPSNPQAPSTTPAQPTTPTPTPPTAPSNETPTPTNPQAPTAPTAPTPPTAPGAPSAAVLQGEGVLVEGARGQDVARLQQQLNNLGYTGPDGKPLQANGTFDAATTHAVKAFERDAGQPQDGIVGPRTTEALNKAEQSLVSNPSHPDNAMYQQAQKALQGMPAGTFANEQERNNAAAALTHEAKVSGMTQIDSVMANRSGSGLIAVQGGVEDPNSRRVYVDMDQAKTQPVRESSQLMQDGVQPAQNAQNAQNQNQQRDNTQNQPANQQANPQQVNPQQQMDQQNREQAEQTRNAPARAM